jgi:hypothetical protein
MATTAPPAETTRARVARLTQGRRERKNAARNAEPLDFVCRYCKRPKRRSEMEKVKRSTNGLQKVGVRCYSCRSKWRKSGSQHWYAAAPDKQPAEHLKDCLASDRRDGMTFETAWPDAVAYVLSCIEPSPDEDLASWTEVFEETKPWWAAAWDRSLFTALTEDLIDVESVSQTARGDLLVA